MSEIAKEAAELIDRLPADEAAAVLAALRARVEREAHAEAEWERVTTSPAHREKFQRFLDEVRGEIARGETEPLDPDKL